MPRAVIFANGIIANPAAARRLLQRGDWIVAADGGLHNALSAGAAPIAVIGDMDSISPSELDNAERTGAQILRFPKEKDETDLELAIRYVLENQATEIMVIGALGGRLDQTLGNLSLLLGVPAGVDIRLDDGQEEVRLVDHPILIAGNPGDVVSLIPWGVAVTGIRTEGLRYPLNGETLFPHQSRGISNEMIGLNASIKFSEGKLIVVHTRM
jgi:thiamine pyrophosphokinase